MTINRRIFFRILKIVVIIYCTIGIALYYLQEKLLFHPEKLSSDHLFSFNRPFKEIQIPVNNTDTISMIRFFSKDSIRRGILVYYHGNRENVQHYEKYVDGFTTKGYEVWMPDYPGFGKSTGERTEKKMYNMSWLVQKMAAGHISNDSIIIYGKSLGTGIAAYAASVSKCKILILETPYFSIPSLFNSYAIIYPTATMSNYKIPTYQFIEQVVAPIVIFHGTGDGVIPYRNAKRLKEFLKPQDKFITIEKGEHNDLTGFDLYKNSIDSLLR